MQDRKYLTPEQLHEDQCYILREKNPENGPGVSYSIVKMVNRTPDAINIKYHWLHINSTWVDAEPNDADAEIISVDINDIVALAPPLPPSLTPAPKFYHFYDLSLIGYAGGRRTRTRLRTRANKKGRKTQRSRK
jgi:hypothetical protein